jgi:hypothetical protein
MNQVPKKPLVKEYCHHSRPYCLILGSFYTAPSSHATQKAAGSSVVSRCQITTGSRRYKRQQSNLRRVVQSWSLDSQGNESESEFQDSQGNESESEFQDSFDTFMEEEKEQTQPLPTYNAMEAKRFDMETLSENHTASYVMLKPRVKKAVTEEVQNAAKQKVDVQEIQKAQLLTCVKDL